MNLPHFKITLLNISFSALSTSATNAPNTAANMNTAKVRRHVSRRLGQVTCLTSRHELMKYLGTSHFRTLAIALKIALTGAGSGTLLNVALAFFTGVAALEKAFLTRRGGVISALALAASTRCRTVGADLRILGFLRISADNFLSPLHKKTYLLK